MSIKSLQLSAWMQSGKIECSPSNRRAMADTGRQLNSVLYSLKSSQIGQCYRPEALWPRCGWSEQPRRNNQDVLKQRSL
jgi:hypothetical protein